MLQDCLDPPLTALPTGLWMCPNHPEHFIDWKLVSSISATERVKLWDQFSGPLDQETVKIDFMRRVHRKNPPYRIKLKPKPRVCAEIPPMVEYHYRHPPQLIPSLRDVLRCEKVHKHGFRYEPTDQQLCDQLDDDLRAFTEAKRKLGNATEDADAAGETEDGQGEERDGENLETDEGVAMEENGVAVKLNGDAAEKSTNQHGKDDERRQATDEPIDIQVANEKTELDHDVAMAVGVDEPTANGIDAAEANDHAAARPSRRKRYSSVLSHGTDNADDLDIPRKIFAMREENATSNIINSERINIELEHLDANVIRQLAFQQLQQILSENTDLVARYQTETANNAIKDALRIKPKKITLPSQMLSKEDIAKIAQEFVSPEKTIAAPMENGWADDEGAKYPVLPFQPPPADGILYTNGLNHIGDEMEMARAIAHRLERPLFESKVRARAVLTPVDDILRRKRYGFRLRQIDMILLIDPLLTF